MTKKIEYDRVGILDSAALSEAYWAENERTIYLVTHHGRVYSYKAPLSTFINLCHSTSPGGFWNRYIKGVHPTHDSPYDIDEVEFVAAADAETVSIDSLNASVAPNATPAQDGNTYTVRAVVEFKVTAGDVFSIPDALDDYNFEVEDFLSVVKDA